MGKGNLVGNLWCLNVEDLFVGIPLHAAKIFSHICNCLHFKGWLLSSFPGLVTILFTFAGVLYSEDDVGR